MSFNADVYSTLCTPNFFLISRSCFLDVTVSSSAAAAVPAADADAEAETYDEAYARNAAEADAEADAERAAETAKEREEREEREALEYYRSGKNKDCPTGFWKNAIADFQKCCRGSKSFEQKNYFVVCSCLLLSLYFDFVLLLNQKVLYS